MVRECPSLPISTVVSLLTSCSVAGFSSAPGSLPQQWAALTKLTALDLNGNELGGLFPAEWSSMTDLSACILYNNYFGEPSLLVSDGSIGSCAADIGNVCLCALFVDSDNNAIRLILPNCRNIDAETPAGAQQSLSTIAETHEADNEDGEGCQEVNMNTYDSYASAGDFFPGDKR